MLERQFMLPAPPRLLLQASPSSCYSGRVQAWFLTQFRASFLLQPPGLGSSVYCRASGASKSHKPACLHDSRSITFRAVSFATWGTLPLKAAHLKAAQRVSCTVQSAHDLHAQRARVVNEPRAAPRRSNFRNRFASTLPQAERATPCLPRL